jgi:threonine dehydrogenase-like Zn-dependent dehydrogenase
MKALVFAGPELVELREMPDVAPAEGQVVLSVSSAGICGSDIHGFLGHSDRRRPGLVMGHETVANVLDFHPSVTGWRRGQRVCFNPLLTCGACAACLAGKQNLCPRWTCYGLDQLHGTYAERVNVPARQLHPLSEGLAEEHAILAEPLAVVIHALRVGCGSELPETLAIVGAGPIGALALVLAKLRGIPRVGVIDVNDERLGVAKTLGADLVLNAKRDDPEQALRDWSNGGAECVVEAVGSDATRRGAIAMAAKGARIILIGLAQNETGLPWNQMIRNEQLVQTSFCYTPRDFETSVKLLEGRRFDIGPWTETLRLGEGQAAFLKMTKNPGATLKMMLRP